MPFWRIGATEMPTATDIFFKRVGGGARKAANAGPDTPLSEIVGRMAAEELTAVVILDEARRPMGILTEQDVVRRIAFNADMAQPARDVMTLDIHAIHEDEALFIAIARMRRRGFRHMPVVDDDGRLCGILQMNGVLAEAAGEMMGMIDALTGEDSIDGLRDSKAALVDVAEQLLSDHVPASDIQAFLTHINGDIYRRLMELNLAAMIEGGLGGCPVACDLIIMGSGGRGENFLYPDQDYGFVLADYPEDQRDKIDGWFVTLAEGLSRDLDAVGLPFCTGGVMATNPVWRKTAVQWKEQIDDWNRRAFNTSLLNFDIFFDFRPAWGDGAMARDLRRYVTEVTRGNEPFLRALLMGEADLGTALRWFGRIATARSDPKHKGAVNLKLYGSLPLVGGVRMLALREGVEAVNTRDRLKALFDAEVLNRDEFEYLDAGVNVIGDLLLRQQFADYKAGRDVSNFVDLGRISGRDKRRLRDSLRAIDALRDRINFEFGGEIF
jgi:CBS domain-containing protein